MRIAQFDTVAPRFGDQTLPCRLEQRASTVGTAVVLTLLLPVALMLLLPFAMLLAQIAAEPATRLALANQPAAAVQIALGFALLSMLIGWPVRALIDRLGRRRIVEIDDNLVSVADSGMFSCCQWSEPLARYRGIAHNVRTTNAGPRHELILVHPERRAHVLLAISDRMNDAEVVEAAARLGLPVVPAQALYRFGPADWRTSNRAARRGPASLEPVLA